MLRKTLLAAAAASFFASGFAQADGPGGTDLEKDVEYRKAVFTTTAYNFKKMTAMVKGETEWDAREFRYRAERVDMLSRMPWEAFSEPSADVGNSEALSKIWDERKKFREHINEYRDATRNLGSVVHNGNKAMAVRAFKQVGKSCKSCHDSFKED